MAIRILVAEDHSIVREGLCHLINEQTDMEVIGQAGNGKEAVELARRLSPDVVIMDAGMPVVSGIEATRQIKAEMTDVKVLALSIHDDPEFVMGMIKAGVSGYLLKDCVLEDLVEAIKTVLTDGSYLSPKIATIVLDEGVRNNDSPGKTEDSIPLSEHEIQILKLLADGYSPRRIAEMQNKSVKTIEGNRRRIMKKLGLNSFASLVKYALKEKLVSGNNLFVKL